MANIIVARSKAAREQHQYPGSLGSLVTSGDCDDKENNNRENFSCGEHGSDLTGIPPPYDCTKHDKYYGIRIQKDDDGWCCITIMYDVLLCSKSKVITVIKVIIVIIIQAEMSQDEPKAKTR